MTGATIHRAGSRVRYFIPVALWLVTVVLAIRDYVGDPPDPTRLGTAAYGHNSEGVLTLVLPLTLVELGVALVLLRPQGRRSWLRVVAALVGFLLWAAASLLMTMHAGGVLALHAAWVVALMLVCVTGMLWPRRAA